MVWQRGDPIRGAGTTVHLHLYKVNFMSTLLSISVGHNVLNYFENIGLQQNKTSLAKNCENC